jgi:hypothetical protein
VNFEKKLFSYFEVLESSKKNLSFWGVFKKNCVKFHKWGNGLCAFFHVNFESFVFHIFFNFLLVILGVFNCFVWSFTRGEIGYFIFFWKIWRSFVLVFWSFEVLNFLVILGVFKFLCEDFTSRKIGYVPFLMWILKVFCFCILKFRNLQFSSCHFEGFTCVEIMLGYYFKIWRFSNLFWWSLGTFNFVLRNFKGFPKCF